MPLAATLGVSLDGYKFRIEQLFILRCNFGTILRFDRVCKVSNDGQEDFLVVKTFFSRHNSAPLSNMG